MLARELIGRDITVNGVAPGAIQTDMLAGFVRGEDASALAERALASPLDRIPRGPGRWVNGQVLQANGGAI